MSQSQMFSSLVYCKLKIPMFHIHDSIGFRILPDSGNPD